MMDLTNRLLDIVSNSKHTKWLCPVLLAADAVLCALIVWKIPYTEIDWNAYMEQVEQYINGERDYTLIKGGTGPLVYPAAHVHIYTVLYSWTDRGSNILLAQISFGVLYLGILAVVMACYRIAKAPPYVFPLLILSKRLHSIFLLRLFNDCFAIGALFIAVYAYQKRMWTIGSVAYSWGVGIKMSLLLALPAVGAILYQSLFFSRAFRQAMLMAQIQFVIAFPFIRKNAMGYLSRAFEFTRQFLFKWTVNWRFVGENVFLSKTFSVALLSMHLALLALFLASRWTRPSGYGLLELIQTAMKPPSPDVQRVILSRITPQYILTTILTANAIGMLCARSLHYQFYSWIAWATPFLLWKAGFHPILQYLLWAAQEWAWNVYPSTEASSSIVVGVLTITVAGVWLGTKDDFILEGAPGAVQKKHPHVE